MASLVEIAHTHTRLSPDELTHLQRLTASWGLVADLCFSDVLLFVPTDETGEHFVVAGQVRPTTNQTLYVRDLIGEITGSHSTNPAIIQTTSMKNEPHWLVRSADTTPGAWVRASNTL